jgi:hypothetical protein
VTRGRVTGWAWDPSIDDRLDVGVLVDGEHIDTQRALIFRESLRRAGIGDGAHAFVIDLPSGLRDSASHKIVVVALAANAALEPDTGFIGESPPGDLWYGTVFTPGHELPVPDGELPEVPDVVTPPHEHESYGMLEAVLDGRAFGWARDSRSPLKRPAVEVIVDGEIVAETVADLLRPSLLAEGIGDGRHGFVVELPARLFDGATRAISVRLSTGETLPIAQALLDGVTLSSSPPPDYSSNGASLIYRLQPSDDLMLPRGTSRTGFTKSVGPETVVLGGEMAVDVADRLHFAVQPGVVDPLVERRKRFEPVGHYVVPPLRASRLPSAVVDTRSFLIMPNKRHYVAESVRHPGTLARWGYGLLEGGALEHEPGEVVERDEKVVVLGAQSNGNYSHWLIESVVRALLFRPLDDGTQLYLTPPLTGWQRETLELVGVGAERTLELEPQGFVRFREIISVSRGMGGLPALRPAGIAALAALAPLTTERRRIYCSRAAAHHRHVTNESEMAALLMRHGFESVCPETLSVKQQIELFATAEAVFALHGSGLTNIVFSPPGTQVIELQPEEFNLGGIVWNWLLASLCDQPFVQVVCPLADTLHDLPHARRDVTVDIPHLDALLYRVLGD